MAADAANLATLASRMAAEQAPPLRSTFFDVFQKYGSNSDIFRSKVDGFVPETKLVNLGIVRGGLGSRRGQPRHPRVPHGCRAGTHSPIHIFLVFAKIFGSNFDIFRCEIDKSKLINLFRTSCRHTLVCSGSCVDTRVVE